LVAHQAPHDPYHLPPDWSARNRAAYARGWDELRRSRLSKQIELGLFPKGTELAPRMPGIPDLGSMPPGAASLAVKRMELYAGMVENFDHHVGRLIEYLKSIGKFDDTLFIVMSDNGAEGTDVFRLLTGAPGSPNQRFAAESWGRSSPDEWGQPGSFVTYGPMWAQLSMTPFSQLKGSMAEGGIRSPLIIHGKSVRREPGSINGSLMHVTDITPTLLDVARIKYPKIDRAGNRLPPLQGKSWTGLLSGKKDSVRTSRDYLGWELFGNRAVRAGDWKIRWQVQPFGKGDWELFNLKTDPAERMDLAQENPGQLAMMVALWEDYVRRDNVILPDLTVFDFMRASQRGATLPDPSFPPIFNFRQFVPPSDMLAEPK
jgi:arylsulfatase